MRAHVVLMTVAALAGRRFAHAGCPITPQAQPTKVQLVTSTPPYSSPYRRAVTFSPDGRYLAIASVDLGMTLWDARTRRPIWTLPFPGGEVAWGADALFAIDEAARTTTRIALADHASSVEHVLRYPMASGSLVIEGERVELRDASDRRTRSLAWPGSARRLASVVVGNDGTVAGIAATVDAESQRLVGGKQLIVWDPTGRGREVAMPSSAWKLALRMGRIFIQGDQLQIFDLAASTFTAGPDRLGRDIAISPTGDRVAYPMGVTVVGQRNPVWEAMPELVRATNSVAFDPSGRMIAFSGTHRVLLVDAATGHTIAKLGPERDLLRATFFDDRTLVTRHGDLISTWDLTSGALDQARSRIVRADSLGVVGGDLLVARLSERRPYNCSPIYIDRWSKGVPPKDLDAAVEGEAPSFEPVTDKPPAVPQGAAKAPYCAAEFTRFEHVDFARLRGLVHPSNQNYRWMDLGGGNEVVLAGSDKLGYKGDVGTDNTVAGIVDGKLLMWSPTGERSELALPAVPDNAPIQWSPPIEIDATRVAVGYGANLVLAQRGGASRTVKTDALPEGISFAGSAVIVRMGDGTLRRYGFDGVEQKRVSIGTTNLGHITAVSPDGKRGVIANSDWTIELWDLVAFRKIASLDASYDGEWVTVTPDGAFTGSAEAASLLAVTFPSGSPSAAPMEPYEKTFRRPDLVKAWFGGASGTPLTAVRAPEVSLVQPMKVDGKTVHVAARVASSTGGGELVAFVDGRERMRVKYCGATSTPSFDLPIAGSGRITLVAFDDRGGSGELAETVVGASPGKPDLWAVVVGIGAYKKLPPQWALHADRDARALARLFTAMKGQGYADVHVTTLIDDDATRASVDKALAGLQKMKPGDVAVVSLAGHGWRTASGAMTLLTTSVANRADAESQGITWTSIRDRLEAAPGYVLVLLDACHAGAFSRDVVVPNEQLSRGLARQGRSGVVVFAAARGRQFSYEVGATRGRFSLTTDAIARQRAIARATPKKPPPPPPAVPKGDLDTAVGLFTSAVIAAFAQPAADLDHDGAIELSELVDRVTASVTKESNAQQTPIVTRRELFGDFAVGPRL